MSSVTSSAGAHFATDIARAERYRDMLEELAQVSMTLAKDIAQRSIDGPYHPEPRHDTGRSFAAVSRAVRLTLALAVKIDEQIFALHNGIAPAPNAASRASAVSAPVKSGPRPDSRPERCVRDRVWEAMDREIGDGEAANGLRDRVRERLIEGEDYEDLLAGDFHACLAAIRADLGLPPDAGEPVHEARIDDNAIDRFALIQKNQSQTQTEPTPAIAGTSRGHDAADGKPPPDPDLSGYGSG